MVPAMRTAGAYLIQTAAKGRFSLRFYRWAIVAWALMLSLAYQPQVHGNPVNTGAMLTARYFHTATLLPNGKVLVTGGYDTSQYLSSAELFDPATGTWAATGPMNSARFLHTATLLTNGKVLVTGGANQSTGNVILSSSELYDPTSGTWTSTSPMSTARLDHSATLLGNGKVLVSGGTLVSGSGNTVYLSSAELFDPATGTWSATASMLSVRYAFTATLLPNGKVLAMGGLDNTGETSSAELYDPTLGTWFTTGPMTSIRGRQSAAALSNGKVVVMGGYNNTSSAARLSTAEMYDPATGTWAATGALINARGSHRATTLSDGKVLVTGGSHNSELVANTELYDPTAGTWSPVNPLRTARGVHTATLLLNGQVLIAGGGGSNGLLASAELYDPAAGTWMSALPPNLTTHPTNRTVNVTSNATLGVTTTGTAPLTYQWFGLTTSLAGATGTALVAGGFVFDAQVVSGGAGYVQAPVVRFVGGGGSGATATATLNNGAVVALTIGSPGSGYTSPPTVQIDPPSGFLPGQTNAWLTLTNVSLNDAGTYFVVVTNAYGSVTSSPATLTVNVPASITQQPQGAVLPFGSNASFTVGAAGTVPLSYQWFWQPAFARAALAVPDVRNGFVVGAAVLSGGGYYFTPPTVQILAGSGSGATASTTVSNGRVTAVNIVSPGSGYPSNAVLQIDPPASGPPQPLSGQTAASLALTAPGALASGSYFVVVTNAGGSATSNPALLRVLVPQRFPQPPERLGDGSFRLRFVSHDGGYLLTNDLPSLEVWGTTNVANTNAWVRLTNGITVTNGEVLVDDADSSGLPRRFYRVLTR